jgi:hypothetical protein
MRCGENVRTERCHLIDRVLGGLDGPQNLVLLCRACHGQMPSFAPEDEMAALAWVVGGPWGPDDDQHASSWRYLSVLTKYTLQILSDEPWLPKAKAALMDGGWTSEQKEWVSAQVDTLCCYDRAKKMVTAADVEWVADGNVYASTLPDWNFERCWGGSTTNVEAAA